MPRVQQLRVRQGQLRPGSTPAWFGPALTYAGDAGAAAEAVRDGVLLRPALGPPRLPARGQQRRWRRRGGAGQPQAPGAVRGRGQEDVHGGGLREP